MANIRLIHSVDKPSNLRTLVKQDLREYGVKVPKLKKMRKLNQSRNSSQDGLMASGIFGNNLSFVPSTYVSDCGFVPKFIVDAAAVIEQQCQMEGIFRKSGSISRQKELKQQIEDGQGLQSESVHDVTGLVKQFFRELPEPLFTSVFHDAFVRCYNLSPPIQMETMLLLCLLLPMEHLSTLRFTMGLLSRLAAHSSQNKMDVRNLAVVLAPNIMHVNSRSQKMNSTEEKLLQIQTSIVELLIRTAGSIGVVSESLFQRTALMNECFGTEDELDASDDNTLEDSKEAKKKRRKRSSSLQGLVSSIGRGIARLRRNSEGKNNLTSGSNYSLANESELTSQSQSQPSSAAQPQEEAGLLPTATPVVMRKRKMSGEVVPFSATKRKAILEQLPQKSALGATPFTPASARKRDVKGHGLETPNLMFTKNSHLAFSVTPKADSKNRKKLNLFSPGSARKGKRNKSGGHGNLCGNPMRKSGKTKHLFRRLSGGKDKEGSDSAEESIDEQMASPSGVQHRESDMELTTAQQSSASTLGITRSVSSPSLQDTSASSSHSRSALNQGFIDPDMTALDSTAAVTTRSPEARGRTLKRADSFRPGQKPARRSASTDGALRRGQPNKLCNGLLEGKTDNVKKLRRSFDKSDIGHPIPIIVPTLPEKPHGDREADVRPVQSGLAQETRHSVVVSAQKVRAANASCEGSARSGEKSFDMESSLLSVVLPPPSGFGDQTMMELDCDNGKDNGGGSDNESEAGFSTISGGTVIHNPAGRLHTLQKGESAVSRSMASYGSSVSISTSRPPLSLQPSTSVDSLISTGSESSAASSTNPSRLLDRSVSIDSGKGSLLDSAEVRTSRPLNTTFVKSDDLDTYNLRSEDMAGVDSVSSTSLQSNNRSIKSLSAEDLKSRPKMEKPTARSQSMYVASSGRHANIVPNLQISAETHRLLTRAGFLDNSLPPNVKDTIVPFKSPQKTDDFGQGFSRDQPVLRSFRLERSGTTRKDRSNFLHMERHSPVKEETTMDEAEASEESAKAGSKERGSVQTEAENRWLAKPVPEVREAEPMEEEVWVRRESCEVRAVEPFGEAAEKRHEAAPKPAVSLKRAELRLQKHDSILHIKEQSAGRVAQNVQQINSSLNHSALNQSNNTSLHFQQCTSRKRGVSPVRIPTIFAKSSTDPSAAYYRELAQRAHRKERQELPEMKAESAAELAGDGSEPAEESEVRSGEDQNLEFHSQGENVDTSSEEKLEAPAGGRGIDLSSSLLDAIEDAITPRRRKRRSQQIEGPHSPLHESTNTKASASTVPDDKPALRTTKGLTPYQVTRYGTKVVGSDRSPGKPVKRLQSPHSPRSRHSPLRHAPQNSRERESFRLESRNFDEKY